ncbi:hypothetical protein O3G_MSEX013191 [Manduca sexta]|uniref:Uncharacterized protein n=1 Tax=Manduca sexta TaxID=7130 RepID=A0A921ZSX1_MANSE|nr:hypothetical protein O3G_MSEX013191 [Manduca sexta]
MVATLPASTRFCGIKQGAQAQPPRRHSTTTRRSARNMATRLLSLRMLVILVVGVTCEPAPGRVPKVYNALITSNQNLEPSKAYPVYQPVLHETYAFPLQPAIFYGGEFPFANSIIPGPTPAPKVAQASEASPSSTPETPTEVVSSSTEIAPTTTAEISSPEPEEGKSTPATPTAPKTQSPIPLNEFGLPPQVIPLGGLNPAYDGFTQVGPFSYTYPGFRFYDPYDPFSFQSLSPYASFPLYRPLTNVLGPSLPFYPGKEPAPSSPVQPTEKSAQTPPPEPSDLNVLNYSSKDPAIPDVPPPPLPQGGLKDDKSE